MTFATESPPLHARHPSPGNVRVKVTLPTLMRKHLPTGVVSECEWTGSQHSLLGDPEGHPARALQRVCDELVAKWNRQQPDIWHYWLE